MLHQVKNNENKLSFAGNVIFRKIGVATFVPQIFCCLLSFYRWSFINLHRRDWVDRCIVRMLDFWDLSGIARFNKETSALFCLDSRNRWERSRGICKRESYCWLGTLIADRAWHRYGTPWFHCYPKMNIWFQWREYRWEVLKPVLINDEIYNDCV